MTGWTRHRATTLAALGLILAGVQVPAAERRSITTERFPSDEGQRIVVDVRDVDVRIRSADITQIEITSDLRISGIGAAKAEQWIEAHTPSFDDSGEELRIAILPEASLGALSVGQLTSRARLAILVPGAVVPDVTTTGGRIEVRGDFPRAQPLRMRTSSGDILFTGAAGSFEIHSSSGTTSLDLFRPAERLFARTASGSITLKGGAREVSVDTGSGDVSLENLSGSAKVETSTGRVTLAWDRIEATHQVRVRSSSGRVHLLLPAGVDAQGTLTTTTGSIESDLPGIFGPQGLDCRLTGTGPVVEVETASTQITVVSAHGTSD